MDELTVRRIVEIRKAAGDKAEIRVDRQEKATRIYILPGTRPVTKTGQTKK